MHFSVRPFLRFVNNSPPKRLLRGGAQHVTRISQETPTETEVETKLLKVAIIGTPNAGKSTLINNLMDRKVCPTSNKVHTTRGKSMAILTENESQIVFLDTPGLVSLKEQRRFNLEKSFLRDCKDCLEEADSIGVLHDVANMWTRDKLDIKIIKLLEYFSHKSSFLILNKVDMLKSKRILLDLTRHLTDNCVNGRPIPGTVCKPQKSEEVRAWPYFKDIFMVSALTGDGLEQLRDYLIKNAKPDKWLFPDDVWSDQTAESLIVNSVKAKFLDFLPQEIPYQLKPEMEFFDISAEGVIKTVVVVHCPNKRIRDLVAGTTDGRLKQINESVELDLRHAFQGLVRIRIVMEYPNK